MILKLSRIYHPEATYGVLIKDGLPICLTLEDPWQNNQSRVSCIPEGTYTCKPHNGEKYKNVWILENVSGRSAILMHSGNTTDDTMGCILVGKSFGQVNGKYGILNSTQALNELRDSLPKEFQLQIVRGI